MVNGNTAVIIGALYAGCVCFFCYPITPATVILHEASKYKLSGDWYFYVMLLLHGDVHYCCKPLNIHRVHSSSVTNSTSSKDRLMEMRKIHQLIESEISISESAKSKARKVEQKFAD
jgi:hypothetical protein